MNEAELARTLVQRGVLSETQVREAESYARGGRSVFSILLDLGHVKPEDLAALVPPPAPPRGSPAPWVFAGMAVVAAVVFGAAAFNSSQEKRKPRAWVDPAPSRSPAFAEQLTQRALDLLRRAEEQAGADGTAKTPEVARAAAMLEQASIEGTGGIDVLYPLARCRELLEQDQAARAIYARIAEKHPGHGRTLAGLSRTALHAGQAAAALAFADRAVQASPGAESFFARAKAGITVGKLEEAKRDLLEAARRDRTYADAALTLIRRVETAR